jgi:predicted DNA-binding protein YlxM (UPF0122 family)
MRQRNGLQHKETILLLAHRIAELPSVQQKVLAMYYVENLQLVEIAAHLGLSKTTAYEILTGTVDHLESFFVQITQPLAQNGQRHPDQRAGSTMLWSQALRRCMLSSW